MDDPGTAPTGGPLQFCERRLVIHKKLCYFLAGFFEAKKDEPGTQKKSLKHILSVFLVQYWIDKDVYYW